MSELKRPLKVFLCHASSDKPKVRELYRYLKKRGIQPWFDEEELVGGQYWQAEIPKALATSDAIIICMTKNSIDKEGYIQKEIKFALDKALEMPDGRIFLIPVKFEECEVPDSLSLYQWVDLSIESGYSKMMRALKFRASQLERSTVEISKKDIDEEKNAHEKKKLEDAERADRERKEKELYENQTREAREKTERETDKKKEKLVNIEPKTGSQLIYWFGGFAVLVLGIILYSSLNNPSIPDGSTPEVNQSQVVVSPPNTEMVKPSVTLATEQTSTPAITPTPTSLPKEIMDVKGVTMRLVSEGEFPMGSESGEPDEKPVHQVYLDAYYMDKYEVTNIQYQACVDAGDCTLPQDTSSYTRSSYYGNSMYDNYPVIYINWAQANAYCEWRGGKLPTEAQWEKAARGTDGRNFPWGEGADCDKANYCENGDTTEVGSYESGKSMYGIYDLAGNVWEWVADWYSNTYYQESPFENPLGPDSGKNRILRGGAIYYLNGTNITGTLVRMSDRYRDDSPYVFANIIGFRCVNGTTP